MISYRDLILSVPFVGLAIGALIIIFVVATGQTFGQRCDRMYPNSPIQSERCAYDLAKGFHP